MITISKDENGLRLFINEENLIATIYKGSDIAIINEFIATTPDEIRLMADALNILAILLHAINNSDSKVNVYSVEYRNTVMNKKIIVPYSPRKIFVNLFSNSVVLINRKDRIKYKFISFGYENGTIIVNYKPVLW